MEILSIRLKTLPLFYPALGWMVGLMLMRSNLFSLAFGVVMALLLLLCLSRWRKPFIISAVSGLFYGFVTMVIDVQQVMVEDHWLGRNITVSATIHDVTRQPRYTRLRLREVVNQQGLKLPGLADVYLYGSGQKFFIGQQIQTAVKFHLPRNKLNPVAFDYETYAFEQHLSVIGSVISSGPTAMTVTNQNLPLLESMRLKVKQALAGFDDESRGVLSALLLAERSMIPIPISDAFAASGATHLLAISGLHVGLVAAWGFALAWWLLTRREAWIVNLPVKTLSLAAGVLCAIAYATLAGWPIPAQRASLMLFAGVVAWGIRAKQQPLNTLFAALLLITLFDPAAVLSVSLWLSFVATAALLIWVRTQPATEVLPSRIWIAFKALIWVSVIASLATLPLIGFIFERFPVWGLLANVLLVPLYAFWVLPLALLGELTSLLSLPALAQFCFEYAGVAIVWGNEMLLFIQTLPAGNLWLRGDQPLAYLLLGLTLLICGFLVLKGRYQSSIPLLCLTLLMYGQVMLAESKVEAAVLHVWDVGQGASSLLLLPGFKLLLDAPGHAGSKFNGGTIAAENARALGVLHLDAVVISHAQSDHAGGLNRLLASLNGVNELWLADVPSNRAYPALKDAMDRVKVRWLKRGDIITLDEATIEVLWPPSAYAPANGNNASLVLLVTLKTGQTMLLPGDMEKQVEQAISGDLRPVDVVLIPHHGSKTSSTPSFVQRITPQTAISQTGYNNHYGFPKPEVLNRYQQLGTKHWNTADGAVSVFFANQGHQVRQFTLTQSSKRKQIERWLATVEK